MKQINVFLFVVFVLVSSVTNAQDYSLKMGLSQIPFRDFPYKERSLPGGRTDGFIIDFDPNIEGKLYEDLQCKQYSLAKNNTDLFPEVYLKIQLSNGLYLGALSFGGCTEYRTDVMFISDANGNVKDTLECCVLNGDLAVKQYEVKSPEEIIIYRMFFAMPVLMKWEKYANAAKPLKGYIRKTIYRISSRNKFEKVSEQTTTSNSFTSQLLKKHNLWEPESFKMSY